MRINNTVLLLLISIIAVSGCIFNPAPQPQQPPKSIPVVTSTSSPEPRISPSNDKPLITNGITSNITIYASYVNLTTFTLITEIPKNYHNGTAVFRCGGYTNTTNGTAGRNNVDLFYFGDINCSKRNGTLRLQGIDINFLIPRNETKTIDTAFLGVVKK